MGNRKLLGLGAVIGLIVMPIACLLGSKKDKEKRDALRKTIQQAFDDKKITRTEYDLIWDLTTEMSLHLAEYYLGQALNRVEAQ